MCQCVCILRLASTIQRSQWKICYVLGRRRSLSFLLSQVRLGDYIECVAHCMGVSRSFSLCFIPLWPHLWWPGCLPIQKLRLFLSWKNLPQHLLELLLLSLALPPPLLIQLPRVYKQQCLWLNRGILQKSKSNGKNGDSIIF